MSFDRPNLEQLAETYELPQIVNYAREDFRQVIPYALFLEQKLERLTKRLEEIEATPYVASVNYYARRDLARELLKELKDQ